MDMGDVHGWAKKGLGCVILPPEAAVRSRTSSNLFSQLCPYSPLLLSVNSLCAFPSTFVVSAICRE